MEAGTLKLFQVNFISPGEPLLVFAGNVQEAFSFAMEYRGYGLGARERTLIVNVTADWCALDSDLRRFTLSQLEKGKTGVATYSMHDGWRLEPAAGGHLMK